jgi:hypothetical protein
METGGGRTCVRAAAKRDDFGDLVGNWRSEDMLEADANADQEALLIVMQTSGRQQSRVKRRTSFALIVIKRNQTQSEQSDDLDDDFGDNERDVDRTQIGLSKVNQVVGEIEMNAPEVVHCMGKVACSGQCANHSENGSIC